MGEIFLLELLVLLKTEKQTAQPRIFLVNWLLMVENGSFNRFRKVIGRKLGMEPSV